ncbi:MAG: hypothetical protein NC218_08830 [Acetobacter sp.]|nr:hypothetical protein [Acetobacter sp.]
MQGGRDVVIDFACGVELVYYKGNKEEGGDLAGEGGALMPYGGVRNDGEGWIVFPLTCPLPPRGEGRLKRGLLGCRGGIG